MTNFEKIKGMNKKELAFFMSDFEMSDIMHSLVLAWEADGDEKAKELLENPHATDSEIVEFWLSKGWELGDYYDEYDSEFDDEFDDEY